MPMSTERPSVAAHDSQRIGALDGLRGVAILMVLAHHLFIFEAGTALARRCASLAEFCGHGVDLFFALSGYLIVRQLSAHSGEGGWALRFWRHRAAKILPTYVACLAFTFVALPALLSAGDFASKLQLQQSVRTNWPWYASFASNFLNARDGRFTNPALDVAWSLGVEVQFYALAFALFACIGRGASRWLAAAIPISILARAAAVAAGANWIQVLVLPWNHLDAFALGALVSAGHLRGLDRLRLVLVIGLPAAAVLLPWSRQAPFVEVFGYTLVALACGAAISLAVDGGAPGFERAMRHPALRLTGAISYSLYLTHLPLRAALRDLLFRGGGTLAAAHSWAVLGLFYLVAGAACWAAGWLVFEGFEDPLRKRLLGRRPGQAAAWSR
jgi:peptidoglycan/LPS O-acetylase OafA/YrhL